MLRFWYTWCIALLFCQPVFAKHMCEESLLARHDRHVQVDTRWPNELLGFYKKEAEVLSRSAIESMNESELENLETLVPPLVPGRAPEASYASLAQVLSILKGGSGFFGENQKNYEREEGELGYCFGRSTFVHLLMLKLGLQKESIRKIWILGPIRSRGSDVTWQFHVATVVYTHDRGWMTVDPLEIKPEPVRDWAESRLFYSLDKKARIYVTDPGKFGADLGLYDRVQMGLDLERADDWYKHYFVDLMAHLRTLDLESLHLSPFERHAGPRVERPRAPRRARGLMELLGFKN